MLPKYIALSVAVLATTLGCGGASTSGGSDGTQTQNTQLGAMSVSYSSRATVSTVSIAGSIGITGMTGGTFTKLTFNPVPAMNQTAIAYNDGGEVNLYSLLTATSALLTTSTPVADTAPSYSHDGRIVYFGVNNGRSCLISMNADATSPVSIQSSNQPPEIPAFSPVNSRVAYPSQGTLKIMTPAGTGLLSGGTTFGGLQTLNLSAGSGTFTLTFKGQTTTPITVSNAILVDTKAALDALSTIGGVGGSVTMGGGGNYFSITFGGTMAYLNEPAITIDASGLVGVSAAQIIQTTLQVDSQRPAWSPDGTKVSVASHVINDIWNSVPPPSDLGIATYGVTGTLLSYYPEGKTIGGISWASDNSKIVFDANKNIVGRDLANNTEWTVDTGAAVGFTDSDPTISPDNKTVVFVRGSTPPALWGTSINGSNPALLVSSKTNSLGHPDWSPFPQQKSFLGTGGWMGPTASGFILGQSAIGGFASLLVFTATTPSTATITAPTLVTTGFVIQADSITSLLYQNVYYGAPVRVIPTPNSAATKILVLYNLRTGLVAGVAPVGKMSVKAEKKGSGLAYSGSFTGFFDSRGVNIAPRGASVLSVDSTGNVVGIQ